MTAMDLDGNGRSCSSSSSGEEDGDDDWRAYIDFVTTTTTFGHSVPNGLACTSNGSANNSLLKLASHENQTSNNKTKHLKHYQLKAQKLLDDILEKSIDFIRDPIHVSNNDSLLDEGGIRLFKHAPVGIVFDHVDELQRPRKRPQILPGKEIDEKSKEFRRQLQSVAVDGMDIMAAARDSYQKLLAKVEAKKTAAKEAVKRENERVAELKKIRGERWLPSMAKEMQAKFQS